VKGKKQAQTKVSHEEKIVPEAVEQPKIHQAITFIPPEIKKSQASPEKLDKFTETMLSWLKKLLNVLIMLIIIALIVTIFYKLYLLFFKEIASGNIQSIIDNILFTLILVELFTILYSYLQKHYIKVERIIEVAIISIVRESLFRVYDLDAGKIYALAVLLVAFGVLFFIEKYYSHMRNM